MTRPARILVWTLTSLFTLLAILVVVIATFDWNRVKPLLNEKVSEALHRPFAINGNLAVHWRTEPEEGGWRAWVPWPHFIAEDLTLGNPDWLKEPDMVGLARVELLIDGRPVGDAVYGRAYDITSAWKISTDPQHPHVAFDATLDTRQLSPGRHWLGLTLYGKDGSVEQWQEQSFTVPAR